MIEPDNAETESWNRIDQPHPVVRKPFGPVEFEDNRKNYARTTIATPGAGIVAVDQDEPRFVPTKTGWTRVTEIDPDSQASTAIPTSFWRDRLLGRKSKMNTAANGLRCNGIAAGMDGIVRMNSPQTLDFGVFENIIEGRHTNPNEVLGPIKTDGPRTREKIRKNPHHKTTIRAFLPDADQAWISTENGTVSRKYACGWKYRTLRSRL